MLLVRGELEVVRPDGGLHLVRVVEALDVGKVADVQRRDVVSESQCKIGEAPVLGDVGADGEMGLVIVLWTDAIIKLRMELTRLQGCYAPSLQGRTEARQRPGCRWHPCGEGR